MPGMSPRAFLSLTVAGAIFFGPLAALIITLWS